MKRIFVYEYLSGGGELPAGEVHAGDALLAMGLAMRDALVADLLLAGMYDVSVAACKLAPAVSPGARALMPRAGESAADFVARQADAHALAWVIAPESGGLLAHLCQQVDLPRWVGCDGPAIALATRKRMTLMHLAQARIATPLAFEQARETRRWVVKPDDGAGALGARLHDAPDAAWADWSERSRGGLPMAIEPWVEGEALSLSLLCGGERRCELLSINRQQLRLDAQGLLHFEGVAVNAIARSDARAAALAALAERVHQAMPGLRGFVGIDLVWHAQLGPVVIEVNPRLTCAYVGLSRALGRNLAAEVIAAQGAGAKGMQRHAAH